jgi:hypothetical protein
MAATSSSHARGTRPRSDGLQHGQDKNTTKHGEVKAVTTVQIRVWRPTTVSIAADDQAKVDFKSCAPMAAKPITNTTRFDFQKQTVTSRMRHIRVWRSSYLCRASSGPNMVYVLPDPCDGHGAKNGGIFSTVERASDGECTSRCLPLWESASRAKPHDPRDGSVHSAVYDVPPPPPRP